MTERRRYQEVGEQLIARIAAEGLQEGDKFPTERQISEEMGISRSLAREAFIMLEIEGHLQVRKGSGSYVCNPIKPVRKKQPDIGPFELLQARQILESQVAGFAASMLTKTDLTRMKNALESEKRAIAEGRSDHDADKEFHLAIAQATQNSVLVDLVDDLWMKRENSSMWARLHSRIFEQGYREKWLDDHENIFDALRQRNATAAQHAMWQHLENVRNTLFELSDVGDPDFDGFIYPAIRQSV